MKAIDSLLFNNDSGAPTFTTRSVGTKLVIRDTVAGAAADFAIGHSSGSLWYSVDTSSSNFTWYAGTTAIAQILGSGTMAITGAVLAQTGTFSGPTYAFIGDTNTGMYRSAAGETSFTSAGTLKFTIGVSNITSVIPYLAPNGAVGAPSFGFSGDTNTGMYQTGTADTLALVTGGNPVLTLTASREARLNDQFDIEVMSWMGT